MKLLPIGTLAKCTKCGVYHDVAFEKGGRAYCIDHAPSGMTEAAHRKYLRWLIIKDGSAM